MPWFEQPVRRIADRARHNGLVWTLVVAGAALASLAAHRLLLSLHPTLAFGFDVVILCAILGVHRENHFFREVHVALRLGELTRARQFLSQWRGHYDPSADEAEVVRLSVVQALVASHQNVFATVLWFSLLPGPTGAVMYRLAAALAANRSERQDDGPEDPGVFACRAFQHLDWIPVRLTATTFAVVGNFEDAILCWRTQAQQWRGHSSGILLASGGGALGVRLGSPIDPHGHSADRPEWGCGDVPRVEMMQATVGLIWRALCLCLLVLTLIAVAA